MNQLPSGSDLCISCGMCCDGSLFERAKLHPDERSYAAGLGMEVLDTGPGFRLPCPLFKGCCSIYDQPRPHICSAFKCKLLLKYENNKVELSDGLAKVRSARAMQVELSKLLPTAVNSSLSLGEVKRQMQILSRADQEERRTHLNFLILAAKYEMFLREHFLLQPRKKILANDLPEMSG